MSEFKIHPSMTIHEACLQASSFLQSREVPEAAAAAEWLLLSLLGWNRSAYLLQRDERFPEREQEKWEEWICRKAAGEPAQYIAGETDFYGRTFVVGPAVLIPRPETEILVEHILNIGRHLWRDQSLQAADIGTGSGAIAVTLALEAPHWQVSASDLSTQALDTARYNALHCGLKEGALRFLQGDLLEPFIEKNRTLDIVVSNPPYIPEKDMAGLQREVAGFEPRIALAGGADGMDAYRKLLLQMGRLPQMPKLVGFEVGQGQARLLAEWMKERNAWPNVTIIPDYAGIERHVIAY